MISKEKKREYNKRYYEKNKEKIKSAQRLKIRKVTPQSREAHRKASLAYYYRQKEKRKKDISTT